MLKSIAMFAKRGPGLKLYLNSYNVNVAKRFQYLSILLRIDMLIKEDKPQKIISIDEKLKDREKKKREESIKRILEKAEKLKW